MENKFIARDIRDATQDVEVSVYDLVFYTNITNKLFHKTNFSKLEVDRQSLAVIPQVIFISRLFCWKIIQSDPTV